MAKEMKQFLDLAGLTRLWNKMKMSFADKSTTEYNIRNINEDIANLNSSVEILDSNIVNTGIILTANTPKEADTYSEALELAKSLSPGVIIKVNRSERKDNSIFIAGIYVVDSVMPANIKYIGTSTGSTDDDKVSKLEDKVSKIESSMIADVKYADDNNEYSYEVDNNKLIIRYDNEYIANSTSVNALTHKAIAAKFGELESIISSIPKFKISIVDELPIYDISPYTIYLLRNPSQGNKNLFIEYIYVEKSSNLWDWEKLGEQSMDISDYITRSEVENLINTAISQTITKAEFNKVITETKQEFAATIDNKIKESTANFIDINDLDELLIDTITTGSVGDELRIPPDKIKEIIYNL